MMSNVLAKSVKIFLNAALILFGLPILALFLVYAGGPIFGLGESREFETQWQQGLAEASEMLAANGYCANECIDRNSIYVSGVQGGFAVYVYGISDTKFLQKLAEIFTKKFENDPKMTIMRFHGYAHTKKEDMEKWFFQKIVNPNEYDLTLSR